MRPMRLADVHDVLAIEQDIYAHPWTLGNFRDSLQAGYSCWVMECEGALVGYGVLMAGVQEAHLLNLSVARGWQRRGFGTRLLHHFIDLARELRGAAHVPGSASVQPGRPRAVCRQRVPSAVRPPWVLPRG